MPYQIKSSQGNNYIVGPVAPNTSTTTGQQSWFLQSNVDAVISQLKTAGITNNYMIVGILSCVAKETLFKLVAESLYYSTSNGLNLTFPTYFKGTGRPSTSGYVSTGANLSEKLANYVYYNSWSGVNILLPSGSTIDVNPGAGPGRGQNLYPTDGYLFRGRGFNQITFRSEYQQFGNLIGQDLIDNPDLLLTPSVAAQTCAQFFITNGLGSSSYGYPILTGNYSFTIGNLGSSLSSYDNATMIAVNINAGLGNKPGSTVVKNEFNKAKLYQQTLIDYLAQNQTSPPPGPTNSVAATASTPPSGEPIAQQSKGNNTNSAPPPTSTNATITQLTQIFPPTIKLTDISILVDKFDKKDQKSFQKGLGFTPFVWYNGVQMNVQDILRLSLYHEGILPSVEITMKDSFGIFRQDGFPIDDTNITLFLNSRSQLLRSIYMDFKILYFKDNGDETYTLTGICDLSHLYTRNYKSYSNMTSNKVLQDVAKECGLGFCTNINDTNDAMTWINTAFTKNDFITSVVLNSYLSDNSFMVCYIDYYYNLCYMDLEKEIERDNSNDMMVLSSGFDDILEGPNKSTTDETTTNMLLTNDLSAKDSVGFIGEFEIINKSTEVSIEKSYLGITKYYDIINKSVLIFNVDSITTDGSKSIIMKGNASDPDFYNHNTRGIWLGKLDTYSSDGSGNMHANYNYALIQNTQNLDDLTKVACKLKLPNPNFTIYQFQNVYVVFSVKTPSPAYTEQFYKRLTGNWVIIKIEYEFDGSKLTQVLTAVKRELSLLPSEISGTQSTNISANNNTSNNNQVIPGSGTASS